MSSNEFRVSDEAAEQALLLGLPGDCSQELARMARRAAPLTHPNGNRRFQGWWLRIEQGEVTAVGRLADGGVSGRRPASRTETEKKEAKARVEKALALHFPRSKSNT